ncbi:PorP/SprF family type IX secretion system membrane protein [Marinifilum caeruleilacunae]|uniref:Type IX secretion system membrane protein PorP/SprF n=1 Tax=Marinifilum caeruleilacunae TaxID=2499076 RepID=A0ABX1X1T9_9BACT|nr:PorP/SprF family type IX secretion system membrane protein [Marinifilum caeruleilacunae]NOU62044.1 type IX secretion system membrane protein PorP/SprF [Marinifilum caeruleilacunae]
MKQIYFSKYIPFCLLLLSCLFGKEVNAQQVPLLDQYYINPTVYNPAAAGANRLFNAYLMRNQKFADFDGGQVTHAFTADAALNEAKYGIGFNLINDNVGIFDNTQALLSYSYRLQIADDHFLRLGLAAGISDFRVNMNDLRANPSDPYLLNTDYKNTEFMANLGLYYTHKNIIVGLTIPQLLNNSVSENNDGAETSYKLVRHAMLSGGYEFDIPRIRDLSITPYVMMRYAKSSPVQFDVNVIAKLEEKGWFAVNYRDDFSVGLNVGVNVLKNFVIGYAYDIGIQKTGRYASNNHEFLIGYRLKGKRKREPERILDNDISTLKTLLAEKYKKIDRLRHELEQMEKEDKMADSDRDGVPDEMDECPKTPPFYIVDAKGCPVDSDMDGVVDSEDYCPEVPGIAANNGCPEQKEERIEMEERLENIYFAFGKFELTEYSRRKLQTVIRMMVENESYILKMHGHTDDIGSDSSNIELAYKRLTTVKNYLILNGVPDNRILIIPHGESKPIVENKDNQSRANNRRVTFEIYSYQ